MKIFKIVVTILGTILASGYASAQDASWPQKTVTIIMPGAPGSSADRMARIIAERLQKKWDKPVIVEYKSGAGGMVGATFVARSAPDGYTMLFGFTSVTLSPLLSANPPYDSQKDLIAVSMAGYSPLALTVRADSKAKTLAEFVAMAKAAGRPLNYGTFGVGTAYHINGETLKLAANIDMTVVPYKGEGPMFVDLLGGQIDSAIASVGLLAPQVEAGKVRALAVIEPTRSRILPDVPTFAEAGYPQLNGSTWLGMLYPAGVPKAVVDKVSNDINGILISPDVTSTMSSMGIDAQVMKADEFGEFLRSDITKWKQMISNAKIPIN